MLLGQNKVYAQDHDGQRGQEELRQQQVKVLGHAVGNLVKSSSTPTLMTSIRGRGHIPTKTIASTSREVAAISIGRASVRCSHRGSKGPKKARASSRRM